MTEPRVTDETITITKISRTDAIEGMIARVDIELGDLTIKELRVNQRGDELWLGWPSWRLADGTWRAIVTMKPGLAGRVLAAIEAALGQAAK
jgi:DNA-binding cell septation regulator SpoVG